MDDYVEISNVDEVLYFLEIVHEKHVTSFDIEKYPLFAKELRQQLNFIQIKLTILT